MKKILMSVALVWACLPSAQVQAQERMTLPAFDTTSGFSGMPEVHTRRVKKVKRVRPPLVRCKDGTIHTNKGPACRGHGGVRR